MQCGHDVCGDNPCSFTVPIPALHFGKPHDDTGFGGPGTRNTVGTVPGIDTGNTTQSAAPAPSLTSAQISNLFDLMIHKNLKLLKDMNFDYSHPVDEYAPQGGNAVITNTVNVQADYDMPERIEVVTYVLPVGTTAATIQLGQRMLTVYSGAALTIPTISSQQVRGIILNSDDPRILLLTGTVTTPPYLGLAGWALTRGQFS